MAGWQLHERRELIGRVPLGILLSRRSFVAILVVITHKTHQLEQDENPTRALERKRLFKLDIILHHLRRF